MATISIWKKALLVFILLGVFLVPVAAQQAQPMPEDLPDVLKMVTDYLGTGPGEGLDFIMAFGIVFAALYLGLSLVPKFSESSQAKAALAAFAGMAAFGTAFYVNINKIPFLSIIAPYSLILVALIMSMVAFWIVAAARRGELRGKTAILAFAFFLTVLGLSLAFIVPSTFGGGWVNGGGAFMAFIGIVIIIISGIHGLWKFASGRPSKPPASGAEAEEAEEEAEEAEEEHAEADVHAEAEREDWGKLIKEAKKLLKELEKEFKTAEDMLKKTRGTNCEVYTKRVIHIIEEQISAVKRILAEAEKPAPNKGYILGWTKFNVELREQKKEMLAKEKACLKREERAEQYEEYEEYLLIKYLRKFYKHLRELQKLKALSHFASYAEKIDRDLIRKARRLIAEKYKDPKLRKQHILDIVNEMSKIYKDLEHRDITAIVKASGSKRKDYLIKNNKEIREDYRNIFQTEKKIIAAIRIE